MKNDAYNFVKKCHACQIHANISHKPPTLLQDMRTPWHFHTWGLDLIGTVYPPFEGYIWILTATEFGIPNKIVTDNGTPFVNKQVSWRLSGYGIKHRRSTPYYPQGNGQAEATNKTLLRILSKLSNAISPVETTISTARVSTVKDLEWDTKSCSNWRLLYLEALDKKRAEAERRKALYHKIVAQAYNRTVKHQAFKQGDLVLKVVEHVRRQVSGPSLFAVKEVYSSGYYHLVSIIEGTLTDPINGKWLKPYCAFVIAFLFVLDMNSFYVLT
ncbi:uncharacterized protein LOC109950307 [Prunus persica]|uniref:uncharacterized protein LOC109950307 n=1 Tax=Prunus persica TaxID=3760 RepID=UPI0009AB9FEE|nr:uncharacterized protein LOC109950307 [Prunus persica]